MFFKENFGGLSDHELFLWFKSVGPRKLEPKNSPARTPEFKLFDPVAKPGKTGAVPIPRNEIIYKK